MGTSKTLTVPATGGCVSLLTCIKCKGINTSVALWFLMLQMWRRRCCSSRHWNSPRQQVCVTASIESQYGVENLCSSIRDHLSSRQSSATWDASMERDRYMWEVGIRKGKVLQARDPEPFKFLSYHVGTLWMCTWVWCAWYVYMCISLLRKSWLCHQWHSNTCFLGVQQSFQITDKLFSVHEVWYKGITVAR